MGLTLGGLAVFLTRPSDEISLRGLFEDGKFSQLRAAFESGEGADPAGQASLGTTKAVPAVLGLRIGDLEPQIPARHFFLSAGAAEEGLDAESQPIVAEWNGVVRQGESLLGLLAAQGVDKDEAQAASAALREVFDSRTLKAGHEIRLSLAPSLEGRLGETRNRLLGMTLSPSAVSDHKVTRTEAGFAATSIERPVTRTLAYREGTIRGSFFGSGKRAGVAHKSLARVVKGFSYDVDFQRDLRAGDLFEIAFESFVNDEGKIAYTGDVVYAALVLSGRRKEIYRFTPKSGRSDFFNAKGESVKKALLRTPVDGARVSSRFGMRRHPILGYSKMHRGVDFAAPTGTPIYAAGDGKVEVARWNGGYGRYIRITHGQGYKTAYAHMTRFARGIRPGKRVKQGDVIGYVGSTGRSTGPHLHYEVIQGGKQINPLSVKLLPGERLKGQDLKRFEAVVAQVDEIRTASSGTLQIANRKSE
ncbi:MAG: peptidoglycan DD-metalloendopeptidase family protein [Pseudomonadota bacterium]